MNVSLKYSVKYKIGIMNSQRKVHNNINTNRGKILSYDII